MWGKRLKEIREKYLMTQAELANHLKKDTTVISRYERGKGAKVLPPYIKYGLQDLFTKDEIEYIEFGKKEQKENIFVKENSVTYGSTDNKDDNYLIDLLSAKLSAGGGIEHYEVEKIDSIAVPKRLFKVPIKQENVKVLEVVGDSMEPTLKDGAYVVIDTKQTGNSDGIYAVLLENALLIKRLQFNLDGTIDIISDNSKYKTQTYNPKEHKDLHFRVLGKAILTIQ